MHTLGGVIYDSKRDEMVVVSHPGHMIPGRFTNVVKHLWGKIQRHPTWTYRLSDGKWAALPCKAVSFFPHSAAYDSDRGVVLGYRPDGVFELGGEPREWEKVAGRGPFGWHNNCAYDAKHKTLTVFGTNTNSNEMLVYRPASGKYGKMPTPGLRPPPEQHTPMAFDPRIGRTVLVIDRTLAPKDATAQQRRAAKRLAEVWLYDLGKDAWQQVPTATLPFGCGMNFNMEYDPHHKVLLLVTGGYGKATAVWALRVEPDAIQPAARKGTP